MTLDKILLTNIKTYLVQTHQKQSTLAAHLNLQRQTVSKMLSGTRTITAVEFKQIADFLGVPMEKLLEDPEPSSEKDVMESFISRMDTDGEKEAILLADELINMLLRQRNKVPVTEE